MIQCVLTVDRDAGRADAAARLPWRLTGSPSRCLQDLVAVAHAVVMAGVSAGKWGPLVLEWPVPAGVRAEAVFHVSPTAVPGWPDQRQYSLAVALALVSALTGRRPRPGVVSVAELASDGRVLPVESIDGKRELDWLREAGGAVSTLLLPPSATVKMRRVASRDGSRRLRELLTVVGTRDLEEACVHALQPTLMG